MADSLKPIRMRGRVSRGGSWSSVPSSLRPARRGWNADGDVYNDTGLRLARTLAISPAP